MSTTKKNIAIITPQRSSYSETFIKQHVEQLKGRKTVYYGGFLPDAVTVGSAAGQSDEPLDPKSLSLKVRRKLAHRFSGQGFSYKEYLLYKSLRRNKVDLLLAEHGPTGAMLVKIAKALSIPMIVHFHGADAFRHDLLERFGPGYREAFDYANYVIAVSEPMRKQLIKLGCPEEKLVKNTYGPHPSFQDTVCSLNEKVFVSIGRLVDKKAPYYTLIAFRKALEKHPDAKLIIAGDGPLLNTCTNLVRYWNLQENVHFHGVVSPQQVAGLFSDSRALVQHSVIAANGDSEGSPVVIIEASAAGLPVIATRHAGIPEVIVDRETGLLVDEHDVEGMAAAMIRLLDDSDYARQLGAAGKQRISDHFSLKKHIQVLDGLIERSLKGQ